ncbi:MAG: SRPBCC domain-containing protein [Terracidiphilus sp.]|jgi:activator of HSP90 ATPase
MATQSFPAFAPVLRRNGSAEDTRDTDWTIAMRVSVNADADRIFQALTVPEYLEAWIRLPGQVEGSTVIVSQKADGYRLDHYRAGRVAASLISTYRFCHRRKMRLSWRNLSKPSAAASRVDFRIRGNFRDSILELRHTGLTCCDEFLWHQQLWRASLGKLTSLLRSA